MIHYAQDLTAVDWSQAAEIFRQAPLGTREPEKLARAFRNSDACVAVLSSGMAQPERGYLQDDAPDKSCEDESEKKQENP
jgi:hypothetical protein